MVNQFMKTNDLDLVFAVNSTLGFQELQSGKRDDSTKNGRKSKNAGYVSNSDPQYSTDMAKVYAAATRVQNGLNNLARTISESFGFPYDDVTQKNARSMKGKVKRKGGDYSLLSMKDHTRTKIEMNNFDQIPSVLDEFDKYGVPYQTEFVTNQWGYRGFHVTWRNEDGIGSEVQLTTTEVWPTKLESDGIFDKWRGYTDLTLLNEEELAEYTKDFQRSLDIWEKADVPDLSGYVRNAASSIGRAFQMSSWETGETGLDHLPSMNSRNILPSSMGERSNMRPSSVSQSLRMANSPSDNTIPSDGGKRNSVNVDSAGIYELRRMISPLGES